MASPDASAKATPEPYSHDAASKDQQQVNGSTLDIPAIAGSSGSSFVAPQQALTSEFAPLALTDAVPAADEPAPPPPVQLRNPHMDHCEGAVNYVGCFMANNVLAYFAHDAVHYAGIPLPGQSGFDACFGFVTFLQDDTQPGMNAFKLAYERALEEGVQYAYIEGTEMKFQYPDYKEPGMRTYIAQQKASQQAMIAVLMDAANLINDVDQTLSENGFDLYEP